ncbi:MAG: pilus assembly protein PilM [Planctomycetota bacterium]
MGTGIDIATTGIKAVKIASGVKPKLVCARFIPRGKDAPESPFDGLPSGMPDRVAMLGLSDDDAVLASSGNEMMVRTVIAPLMDDERLDRHIRIETLDRFSDGAEPALDWRRLNISPLWLTDKSASLSTIVRAEQLDALFNESKTQFGVRPRQLTPASEALHFAFVTAFPSHEKTSLVLDIGASRTELALIREGDLLLARMLPVGGNKINETLVKRLGLAPDKAEAYKRERACVQFDNRGLEKSMLQLNAALRETVNGLAQLATTAVAFIKRELRKNDLDFDEIVITGAGSKLNGLKAFFEQKLKKPVVEWSITDALDLSGADADSRALLTEQGAGFAVSVGAALIADSKQSAIALAPQSVLRSRNFKQRTIWGIAAAVLVILSAAGFVIRFSNAKAAAIEKRSRFETGKASMTAELAAVEDAKAATNYAIGLERAYSAQGVGGAAFAEAWTIIDLCASDVFTGGRLKLSRCRLDPIAGNRFDEPASADQLRTIVFEYELAVTPDPAGLKTSIPQDDLERLEAMKERLRTQPLFNGEAAFDFFESTDGFRIDWRLTVKEPVVSAILEN